MISIDTALFNRYDTIMTRKNTAKAPVEDAAINPHSFVCSNPIIPDNIIKMATPNEEPDEMPSTNGPATGFLKYVCICKPLNESAAPPKVAAIAAGRRD